MKTIDMFRRVENISGKLEDTTAESFLRVDFNSLSEAEKTLFRKVDEISEEYKRTGNEEILAKNDDLICKNIEVMKKRITELYCYSVPLAICGYTALDYEIVNHFFQLHFLNFEIDLLECVKNLKRWNDSDRQEFLCDLKKNGHFYFRIPRGFNTHNDKTLSDIDNSKEDQEIEDKNPQD